MIQYECMIEMLQFRSLLSLSLVVEMCSQLVFDGRYSMVIVDLEKVGIGVGNGNV